MNSASTISPKKATEKRQKKIRSITEIANKTVAYRELLAAKKSGREAASLLLLPNSTMQSWITKEESCCGPSPEVIAFFRSPAGTDVLMKVFHSADMEIRYGTGGIDGLRNFMKNTGLDYFVATSDGALNSFCKRKEEHIISFADVQEEKLSKQKEDDQKTDNKVDPLPSEVVLTMEASPTGPAEPNLNQQKKRKISAALDELFKGRRPCLVAIELISNYILLEKSTRDRTAETWNNELTLRLQRLNLELEKIISDIGSGICACAKKIKAMHIPELFHGQYEITKATAAALASQERAAEKDLNKAEEKLKKIVQNHGEHSEKAKEAEKVRDLRKLGLDMRKERSEKVRKAKKNLSKIHHPINLKTGKLQTAEEMKNQFDEEFTIIESCANEACLSQSCMDRPAKAKRHFAGIVVFLYSSFSWYTLFVDGYKLESEMRLFFDEVIFPLSYLKITWKKLSKKDREEIQPLKAALEARLQQATYSQETKKDLMAKGKECAEGYQRSSSCVEGRNGVLSFYHHRFHRLNDRCLKCLTILHNFHRTRSDNTTAAERFFGCQHENLFDSLVANVRIPGRPQKQHHDAERRQAGWEKRRAATTPVAA